MLIKKSLGQHFLKDEKIIQKILHQLLQHSFSNLLEIGPGTGVLTKHLVAIPNIQFKAVEIDKDKFYILQPLFTSSNTQLIEYDILELPSPFVELFFVIGNFPYNISTQIIFKILEWKDHVQGVIGMFQKEVAQRIAAKPRCKEYGITSILTQIFFETQYLFDVPAESFFPKPKIVSGVLQLTKKKDVLPFKNEVQLWNLVKMSFGQRRKMLRNSVGYLFEPHLLKDDIFTMRPEQLTIEQFCALTFKMKNIQ